jgi:hypothetical protein
MSVLNTTFAVETTDRAIKSFAQAIVLYFGVGEALINAFEFDWVAALGFGLGGAALSVLTSFASGSIFKRTATPASILSKPPIPDPGN